MSIESSGPRIRTDLGKRLYPADGVYNNVVIKKSGEVEKREAAASKVDKIWEELKKVLQYPSIADLRSGHKAEAENKSGFAAHKAFDNFAKIKQDAVLTDNTETSKVWDPKQPAGNAYGLDGIKGEIKGEYKDKINFNPNAYKHASDNAQIKASIKSAVKLPDETGILIGLDEPAILIGLDEPGKLTGDKFSPAGNAFVIDGGGIKGEIKGEYKDKINFNPNAYKHASDNAQIKASIKSAVKLPDEKGILIGLDEPAILIGLDEPGILIGDKLPPAGYANGFDGIKGEIKGEHKDKINFNPNAYKHASDNAQIKASIKSAIKLPDETGILIGLDEPAILIGLDEPGKLTGDKFSPAGNAFVIDGGGIKGEYKDKINFNTNAYKHASDNAQIKASIKSAIKLPADQEIPADLKIAPSGNAYGYPVKWEGPDYDAVKIQPGFKNSFAESDLSYKEQLK